MNLKLDRHGPTANPKKSILENSSAANRKIIYPLNESSGMVESMTLSQNEGPICLSITSGIKFASMTQTHCTCKSMRVTLDFQIQILKLKVLCQRRPPVGIQSMISRFRVL